MNLRALIEDKYKNDIKSKKFDEANTLRLIKSAIKDKDTKNRSSDFIYEINDQQISAFLQNLIKQREDSIRKY